MGHQRTHDALAAQTLFNCLKIILSVLLSITEFIGRFHPLFVHLPIGILLLALLLQWLSRKEQYTLSHGVMKVIWALGIFSALLSCITGYLLSLNGEYEENIIALHMWMGIGTAALSLLIGAKVFSRQFDSVYKFSSVALLFLIMGTGHFGGSLTHGEDYLTAALGDEEETAPIIKPIANVQEADLYADVVQPLLQSRCYSCHGAKKQKGKLRMDSPEFLLKGGEDGEIIVPGKGDASELIKRLLLPVEDEDHMPPKQKPQLKEKQIALLHWWIEQGAPFDKKVKDLQQPEKLKPVLASLEASEQKEITAFMAPQTPVEAGDAKAIEALRNKGVVILPIAQNSNYLMANFVTATKITDADLALLVPLKKQLVWLKLNDAPIGDSSLQYIGQCTNLRLLQLNYTAITDKGLVYLKPLQDLQSLHLVGTGVTGNGILKLKDLSKLQSLYLYQTKTDGKSWPALKAAFPKTIVDTGGYTVPTLASDTTAVKPNLKKN
jgi:mono/diheme cytochrome c family protein/uncharacterized membrane protein